MQVSTFKRVSRIAFDITAFSILGLLFVAKPTTFVPTLVLLLASVALFFNCEFRERAFEVFTISPYKWIARAMLIWWCISLILALIHHTEGRFYFPENALRMAMALTLLAMCVRPNSEKWFISGAIVAGQAAMYWALMALPWSVTSRPEGVTNNAIHFGNLSAIIMMLSLTMAIYSKKLTFNIRLFLFFSGLGGLVGAVASLSRSSALVLLCLLPLALLKEKSRVHKCMQVGMLVLISAACLTLIMSPVARDKLRITEALADIENIKKGNYISSLGARMVMWEVACTIFKESPIVGGGQFKFRDEIDKHISAGEIPSTETYAQPHSDIMHALSSGGLLKFLSYLGILGAPFVFFFRRYREVGDSAQRRLMPIMGMQVVGAYFLTGLTNSNFDLQIYSTTYAVLVCVLAKLSMQVELV